MAAILKRVIYVYRFKRVNLIKNGEENQYNDFIKVSSSVLGYESYRAIFRERAFVLLK